MRRCHLAVVLALLVSSARARAQFGDLAPHAALYWRLGGVQAEAGVTFAMDPAFLAGRVPRGFRAFTLGRLAASGDSAARATLAAHPAFANYAVAVLFVARLDSATVEGETGSERPGVIAGWWIPVRPIDTTAALPDPRARAGEQLVELGSWSADARFSRRLGAVVPSAAPASLTMTLDPADSTWRIRLAVPGATVVGSCRPRGAPLPVRYPLPQYSTAWTAGSAPGAFVVYTYYGHRTQPCSGAWHATGDAPLARALRTGAILGTADQSGWRARAAAYAPR